MKIMKKLIGVLAVLLLCTAFVGAGAAFTITESAKINPSGFVSPYDKVTADITIEIPSELVTETYYVKLGTDLNGAVWSTKIYNGDVYLMTVPHDEFLPIHLTYPSDVTLVISLKGTVSPNDKGKEINVLEITSPNAEIGGVKSYSSPNQYVNNPDDLKGDLEKINTRVETVESRIDVYAGYGFDTTSLTQKVTQAETYITAAINAGTADPSKAFSNINSAISVLDSVEMTLANTGLTVTKDNMGQIETASETLYERGWNSEAQYLETKNTRMEITYNSLKTTYDAGSVPDASKLDELVADSYETLDQANEYLEKSEGIPIMQFLPFIIGGVVAVAAVVGIVFLIRRRRANSWDELG